MQTLLTYTHQSLGDVNFLYTATFALKWTHSDIWTSLVNWNETEMDRFQIATYNDTSINFLYTSEVYEIPLLLIKLFPSLDLKWISFT